MKKISFSGLPPSNAQPGADAWVAERTVPVAPEPTRRFTFDVPVSLHRRIKARCVEQDRTIADAIRELLEREFLGKS